jgi:hypothetical protein
MKDKIPAFIAKLIARHPLLADEHQEEFLELFETIRADESPQAFQEWMSVFEITCEVWELLRLRGLKVRVLHVGLLDAFDQERAVGHFRRIDTIRPKPQWLAQFRRDLVGVLACDAAAKQRMDKLLASEGFTLENVVAAAFARKISTQLSADRLVEASYQRRNALYTDLQRLRAQARLPEKLAPKVESPSVADGDEKTTSRSEVGSADKGQSLAGR